MKVLVHNSLVQDPGVIPAVRAWMAGRGLPPGCRFVIQQAGAALVVKPANLRGIDLFSPQGANYRELHL
jgi:hypothetical protein